MNSSTSDPSAGSPGRRLGLGFAVVLIGSSLFARSVGLVSLPALVGLAVLLGVVVLWRRATRGSDSTNEDDSSVWNAIPNRQYQGRHVESGGLARSEQEAALADVQQRADELSDDPSRE
ncbi:hypothetical protein [Natrarchaeobius oligotrophus]|uniref:Uncharacterized protein n=1 Tax=Natrarchaeobius chitinivorans TaxID=1679083 RepID=A0A3N6N058_NATCH|nr:hypothetical protein [Natrarchaeobius chitinivorans]RQH00817.1 hypothetical protein EA472_09280 [Natrarchaeobius chitinivorans]